MSKYSNYISLVASILALVLAIVSLLMLTDLWASSEKQPLGVCVVYNSTSDFRIEQVMPAVMFNGVITCPMGSYIDVRPQEIGEKGPGA